MKDRFIGFIHDLQDRICTALERCDGQARFVEDAWTREGGGGGRTRVIAEGAVFEKGGVNTSVVHGELPELIRQRFGVEQGWFLAAGISLVIHPRSPLLPTVHANYRYFELYDTPEAETVRDSWFGGGADLTPYYLVDEDARHFHHMHRQACDAVDRALFPRFKRDCDDYFFNAHRGECRGVGGIFYDYLRPSAAAQGELNADQLLALAQGNGQAFIDAYVPIVDRHKHTDWTEEQRYWQELRRGRYVEFNLIHDRGTLFGLKTNGRVESILMSLPPRVRWDYDAQPAPGSEEERLTKVLRNPVSW